MIKKLLLFIFILTLTPTTFVFAMDSEYITNPNGVTVTEEEKNFIDEFYGENYFYSMTEDDYLWIEALDVNNRDVEIQTFYDIPEYSLASNYHQTSYKKLTIARSCSTICTMVVNTTWLVNPTVRSYDVIGARFSKTSLASDSIVTRVISSNGTEYFSNTKVYSNGFGTSVKLPSSGSNISVEQLFYVNLDGTVYASYQHSIKSISLYTSTLYVISSSGYGSVFSFYGDAVNCFDEMNGVNIDV